MDFYSTLKKFLACHRVPFFVSACFDVGCVWPPAAFLYSCFLAFPAVFRGIAPTPLSVLFFAAFSLYFGGVLFFFGCLLATGLALACLAPLFLHGACLACVAADHTLLPFLGLSQVAYLPSSSLLC